MESSRDAIITKSLDGTITGWNSAAERMFGFTAAEAVGKLAKLMACPLIRTTGTDASVIFHLKDKKPWMRSQFVTIEQGHFENGAWKPLRLWNGDEVGGGFSFHQEPEVVRVKMQKF